MQTRFITDSCVTEAERRERCLELKMKILQEQKNCCREVLKVIIMWNIRKSAKNVS
jgi:hypothetical protein